MKSCIIGIFTIVSFSLNAQPMETINETVSRLFIATDQQDWYGVKQCFASEVELDYSSMTGNPATILSPEAIVESWKGILPGFTHTHHQLGNFINILEPKTAKVFCYGTATHYLDDEKGSVWTVVGSYDFDLMKNSQNEWRISKMTFHYKYQTGNTHLPEKAIANLKK